MYQKGDKLSVMYLSNNYSDVTLSLFKSDNYNEYMFTTYNDDILKILEVSIIDKYKTEIGHRRLYKLYKELKNKNLLVLLLKEIN